MSLDMRTIPIRYGLTFQPMCAGHRVYVSDHCPTRRLQAAALAYLAQFNTPGPADRLTLAEVQALVLAGRPVPPLQTRLFQ